MSRQKVQGKWLASGRRDRRSATRACATAFALSRSLGLRAQHFQPTPTHANLAAAVIALFRILLLALCVILASPASALARFQPSPATAGIVAPPVRIYLYAHADPVNRIDPSGQFVDVTSTLFAGAKQFTLQTRNAAVVQVGRMVAAKRIAEVVATTAVVALSIVPLGEVQTDYRDFNPELMYRGMTEDGAFPKVGDSARTLGVRLGVDITPGPGGFVMPGTGGMSVAPKTPMNLPPFRRPRVLLGTSKDPVWGICTGLLGPDLLFRQDSPTHGMIEPAFPMPVSRYQSALSETRGRWIKVAPGD